MQYLQSVIKDGYLLFFLGWRQFLINPAFYPQRNRLDHGCSALPGYDQLVA